MTGGEAEVRRQGERGRQTVTSSSKGSGRNTVEKVTGIRGGRGREDKIDEDVEWGVRRRNPKVKERKQGEMGSSRGMGLCRRVKREGKSGEE